MTPPEAGQFLWYSAPMISAGFCLCMLLITWRGRQRTNGAPLYAVLATYFSLVVFNWGAILTYTYLPSLYLILNIPCYYSFMVTQVILYHFTYLLTDLPGKKPFPKVHYLIPTFFVGTYAVWTIFIPNETLMLIIESRKGFMPDEYGLYGFLFSNRKYVRLLWSIVYTIFIWLNLIRYLRTVGDYSADTGRSSLIWVKLLIVFSLSMMAMTLGPRTGIENDATVIVIVFMIILSVIIQHSLLCYNTIVGNYVPVDKGAKENTGKKDCKSDTTRHNGIKKEVFENYMRQNEPWLEPTLRITDLSLALHTNRTALSAFINAEYGMNFSRYINRQRLKEMDTLKHAPEYKKASLTQLAMAAGFSSYRSYHLFKQNEKRLTETEI